MDPREELQALRRLAELEARAPQSQGPTYGAVAGNAGNKAIAGTADMLLNAPTNLWNLGKAGYGAAATALGRPELAPELTQTPDFARRAMTSAGFIRPEAEPQTTGQRMLDSTVQGGVGAMMNPAGSLRQAGALMATGGGSGLAASATREATGSDTMGNLVAIGSPLAITAATGAARNTAAELRAQASRNAPIDNALRAGLDAGFQVAPGQAQAGKGRLTEGIAGKAGVQQAVSTNNLEVADAMARRAVRIGPNDELTPEAMQAVRSKAYQAGYEPLKTAGPISTGKLYRQELDDIESQYRGAARSFPDAVRDDVPAMVKALRRRSFDAGDAVNMSATLREDASASFASGNSAMGKAQRAAAEAIENQIERGLGTQPNAAQLMQNFRDARQLMARSHTVEDAIRVGGGHVDATKLATALQNGAPLDGELRVVAEFANNFKKSVQQPQTVGSPGVSHLNAVLSGSAGVGSATLASFLGGGPVASAAAGAAAMAVPYASRAAAMGRILSPGYQKSLLPSYDQGLASQFMGSVPNLQSGAVIPPALFAEQLRRQAER